MSGIFMPVCLMPAKQGTVENKVLRRSTNRSKNIHFDKTGPAAHLIGMQRVVINTNLLI